MPAANNATLIPQTCNHSVMRKIDLIKEKYLSIGVREDNIEFAIGAVLDGTKREIIIETLTADYRGMTQDQSSLLLEELFEANGGEFKKENSGGYLYGSLLTFIGLLGAGFFIAMLITGESKPKLLSIAGALALFGLFQGPFLLHKSFKGKYRDDHSPFENS